MSIDDNFEITEEGRILFFDKTLENLPEEEKVKGRERAEKICNSYQGRDVDALSVLFYASERGKFEEYAKKLEEYHEEDLKYVHPEARRVFAVPGARRAESFIISCYKEMGIKPREE